MSDHIACKQDGCDTDISRGAQGCIGGCGKLLCAEHTRIIDFAPQDPEGMGIETLCPDCYDAARTHFARAACSHPNIVESKRHPDGSIDGRCADCGEDGFPLRDVAYEEWVASGEAPKCGTFEPRSNWWRFRSWLRRVLCWHRRRATGGFCVKCGARP